MTQAEEQLIEWAVRPTPVVFAGQHNDHVRRWRKMVQRQVWILYHASTEFARKYEAAMFAQRNLPMPKWKENDAA